MIKLPSNWLKQVRVREYPHDPARATLVVAFINEHGQTIALYQQLEGTHGMTAASQLEVGLVWIGNLNFAEMEPYVNATSRETAAALDQNWTAKPLPNTLNLKDFRAKHGLRDPEEAKRV